MMKFAQFILEKLDSENPDIVIDKIGHDDLTAGNLYDSTPLTGGRRRTRNGQNPEHPIVSAIQKLRTDGNSDLVFKINHGDTTHTIRIPPVEGEHARGRVDFSHEITQGDETTTEHHELKLKSTPKTALGGKDKRLINWLEQISSSSGTLRRNLLPRIARVLLRSVARDAFNMPKIKDKDKRYLNISTVRDHTFLHPDPATHHRIVDEIEKLPKNKQKLVYQALRLMYERITAHTKPDEKIESEFHSTDLDNPKQVDTTVSHYAKRMSYLGGNNTYISVETGKQNDHAVIRVDPKDLFTLQHHLENNLPLKSNHPLHGIYIQKIIPTGRYKTTIEKSHEDALKIIGKTRKKLEVNTRTTPE